MIEILNVAVTDNLCTISYFNILEGNPPALWSLAHRVHSCVHSGTTTSSGCV